MFKAKHCFLSIIVFTAAAYAEQPILIKSPAGGQVASSSVNTTPVVGAVATPSDNSYDQQLKDLRKKLALAELRAKIAEQEKVTQTPSSALNLPPPPMPSQSQALPALSKSKVDDQSPSGTFEVRSIVGPKGKLVAEINYNNVTGKFSAGDTIMNAQWRVSEINPKYVQICGKKICENIGVSGF